MEEIYIAKQLLPHYYSVFLSYLRTLTHTAKGSYLTQIQHNVIRNVHFPVPSINIDLISQH